MNSYIHLLSESAQTYEEEYPLIQKNEMWT